MRFAEKQKLCSGEGLETGEAKKRGFEDFETGALGGGKGEGGGGERFGYCMNAVFGE